MLKLRGITWGNARGYDPLIAVNNLYHQFRPDVEIIWDQRSLKDFGDFPVHLLAEKYDLLVIDHPFIAQAYKDNVLVNLSDFINENELVYRRKASVGFSYQSYECGGEQLAIPVDAAAQVSALRWDMFQKFDLEIPQTLDDVFDLYKNIPKHKKLISTMCPTDLVSTYFSICAQLAGNDYFDSEGINITLSNEAISILKRLLDILAPESIDLNPVGALDLLSKSDDYLYCMYTFGYSNYARKNRTGIPLVFKNAPCLKSAQYTTLLGGAGLAISSKSKHIKEAAEYILLATSRNVQEGIYYECGGQPADLNAWKKESINSDCGDFFVNTLYTLEHAFVRPQLIGWNRYQEKAGQVLRERLVQGQPNNNISLELNGIFKCDVTSLEY